MAGPIKNYFLKGKQRNAGQSSRQIRGVVSPLPLPNYLTLGKSVFQHLSFLIYENRSGQHLPWLLRGSDEITHAQGRRWMEGPGTHRPADPREARALHLETPASPLTTHSFPPSPKDPLPTKARGLTSGCRIGWPCLTGPGFNFEGSLCHPLGSVLPTLFRYAKT